MNQLVRLLAALTVASLWTPPPELSTVMRAVITGFIITNVIVIGMVIVIIIDIVIDIIIVIDIVIDIVTDIVIVIANVIVIVVVVVAFFKPAAAVLTLNFRWRAELSFT